MKKKSEFESKQSDFESQMSDFEAQNSDFESENYDVESGILILSHNELHIFLDFELDKTRFTNKIMRYFFQKWILCFECFGDSDLHIDCSGWKDFG